MYKEKKLVKSSTEMVKLSIRVRVRLRLRARVMSSVDNLVSGRLDQFWTTLPNFFGCRRFDQFFLDDFVSRRFDHIILIK